MSRTTVTTGGGGEGTRQPYRVIVGHCPKCGQVTLVENHFETWPLVVCKCGWEGATDEVANRVRFELDGVRKDGAPGAPREETK